MPTDTVIISPRRGTASRATLRTHEVDTDAGLIRHRDSLWWNEHESRGDWSPWSPFNGELHVVDVVTRRWCMPDLVEKRGPYLTRRAAEKARSAIIRTRGPSRLVASVQPFAA